MTSEQKYKRAPKDKFDTKWQQKIADTICNPQNGGGVILEKGDRAIDTISKMLGGRLESNLFKSFVLKEDASANLEGNNFAIYMQYSIKNSAQDITFALFSELSNIGCKGMFFANPHCNGGWIGFDESCFFLAGKEANNDDL